MKKLILLVFVIVFTTGTLSAQETKERNNAVYAEAGGLGLFWSINYERNIIDNFAVRAGYGNSSFLGSQKFFPVSLQYVQRLSNIYIDGGIGFTAVYSEVEFDMFDNDYHYENSKTFFTYNIGMRVAPDDWRILLKLYYLGFVVEDGVFSSMGVGLGFRF